MKKLAMVQTGSEAESIIKKGYVLINGKAIKDTRYPVGLNDIVEITKEGKSFRIGINNRGQITMLDIKKPDYDALVYKVIGKYKTNGNALMLKLHDGSVVKCSGETKVNDSVVVNSKGAVAKTLKLSAGARCMVIDGVHAGSSGIIKAISEGTLHKKHSASVQPSSGTEFETHVENIMITE
jgi:small subunit ribosomal protein S4e